MRVFGKDRLLEMVSTGWTTRRIAAQYTVETGSAISQYYVVKCLQTFGQDYEAAKRAAALHHADAISDLTEDLKVGKLDPASARISSDNHKWLASRLDPRQYGDKIQAEIQTTDMTQVHMLALRDRLRLVASVVPESLPILENKGIADATDTE